MGKHSGDSDLGFFELKNAKIHEYDAQPIWTANDEARLIYVNVNEPTPAKRGYFRGSSSQWDNFGSGGSAGVDIEENGVVTVAAATPLDFQTDVAGGKPFADIVVDGSGADIEIDKQINYDGLAGSVGPVPTGFTFDNTVYRACELIYTLEKDTGELEAGHIMMLHDGSVAGVVVTRRGSEVLPFTQGHPAVQFSADISGNDCRLLYTETNGNPFNIQVKPRPIRINTPPAPQTVTVQFSVASSSFPGDTGGAQNIGVSIITSDGNPLAGAVTVDVADLLTGSAINPTDYTMTTPQTLNWIGGDADGTVKNAVLTVAGVNGPTGTVDLELDNESGASQGVQNTHLVTIPNVP